MSIVFLPHAPASVAVARRHLSRELLAWGVTDTVVDDAAVIISELLSNALRHARALPGGIGQIKVTWSRHGDEVEVAVTDGGAATDPRKGQPALSSLGGRGLGIVETLAQSWGVRREGEGSTVWASLHAPACRAHVSPAHALGGETGTPVQNLR
ncbi:MAG: ATP-binding protein [Streptosporangiaceae bacterium]